jgi:hypothetical protein
MLLRMSQESSSLEDIPRVIAGFYGSAIFLYESKIFWTCWPKKLGSGSLDGANPLLLPALAVTMKLDGS